ncbi:hypothetical protein PENSPDRAFT_693585 [Peniophora sp. CONT]|nr:hypothetical protein PENSPDRAFT_693585 [Peniophora sp. CONT]
MTNTAESASLAVLAFVSDADTLFSGEPNTPAHALHRLCECLLAIDPQQAEERDHLAATSPVLFRMFWRKRETLREWRTAYHDTDPGREECWGANHGDSVLLIISLYTLLGHTGAHGIDQYPIELSLFAAYYCSTMARSSERLPIHTLLVALESIELSTAKQQPVEPFCRALITDGPLDIGALYTLCGETLHYLAQAWGEGHTTHLEKTACCLIRIACYSMYLARKGEALVPFSLSVGVVQEAMSAVQSLGESCVAAAVKESVWAAVSNLTIQHSELAIHVHAQEYTGLDLVIAMGIGVSLWEASNERDDIDTCLQSLVRTATGAFAKRDWFSDGLRGAKVAARVQYPRVKVLLPQKNVHRDLWRGYVKGCCDACWKQLEANQGKRCSGCNIATYCNKTCQKRDRKRHTQSECGHLVQNST